MRFVWLIMVLSLSLAAFGQNERKFIREGNQLYEEAVKDTMRLDTATFSQAESAYRKALNKKPGKPEWEFNLADALYKQKRFEEAETKFNELHKKLETPEERARALHNLGNSQLMQQKIDESIESYKNALRKNPYDLETKYNLAYAQMLKKKQEQQQQQQNDQNKDQQKDQNQQNQQNQNQQNQQNQNNQQNQQEKQRQDQQKQEQQRQQQQNKISKQDAEQLLQALQNDEKDIQEKVKKAKAVKAKEANVEKEW